MRRRCRCSQPLGSTELGRNWAWVDEDAVSYEDEEYERVQIILDEMAKEWTSMHEDAEREQWERQARQEEGRDYEPEDPVEARHYRVLIEAHREIRQAKMAAIESRMSEYGARMARPYEHWNEDERLMEYLETRYDSEDD